MSSKLVIVESPTKAKTIKKYLGVGYKVTSSFGHVRDLPKSRMGIDIKGDTFEPEYEVSEDKAKVVATLKKYAKDSSEIIFATDGDREGEAISWHLAQILKIKPAKAKRIVFHEITKHAIEEALKKSRFINQDLVDAQQARRVLDRLVGYELSPFLWKKVVRGLSAGRVQSVAVRLVVEREREIKAFNPEEYWSVTGLFSKDKSQEFPGKLATISGKRVGKMDLKTKKQVDKIVTDLKKEKYVVSSVKMKKAKKSPPPPFTTSTLQQKANQTLGFSAKQTMRTAQKLYEGVKLGSQGMTGLITYMRTDSMAMSEKFIKETDTFLTKEYGKEYASGGRRYKTKAKGAQEAHEAIRPTNAKYTPESLKKILNPQQYRLYNLIWKRAIATQMSEAILDKTVIDISAGKYTFRVNGQIIVFNGWLKLYPKLTKEDSLPKIEEGEKLKCSKINPLQHFTEPPARYSDATLVKALEEHEIGRPSTYAPTINTIESRGYVFRNENKRLQPKDIAFTVNDLLVKHFPNIVNLSFTAQMENDLDKIAEGKKEWIPLIKKFYKPFHKNLEKKTKEVDKKDITEEKSKEKCPKCKSPMVIKLGRFGKFLACTDYPECKTTQPIDGEEKKEAKMVHEKCEKCGEPMALKHGRFGPFLGCSGYPDCKNIKSFAKSTGVKCNKCKTGEIVEKKSKKGRTFFACNQYPKCENALWSKPTGKKCTKCKQLIVEAGKDKVKCSNKECK
ncbi:MAG: type I DNA topoisomerase [Candidatus Magasanikbacteria bacterium]|nr:type I DNA topoisomerase [Candidatus Magasanikbacteria bacterium]